MKLGFHKLTALILVLAMMVPFLTACKEEPVNLQEVYKFSETAVTLNAGENYALLVYDDTYSDRAYTAAWSSDNPAVVSVEQSGFITALSAGSANVTATLTFAEEQQTVTLTCEVTVLQTVVNVTGISLNAMEQTLDVGGVTVLTATVLPDDATNKAVSWSSSDPAVAIVSSGVVTAVGAGTAIITAVTEDGAKTAECVITVNQPVDVFESLTLNRTSTSINVGKSVSLTATVKPTGVAANIIWTSGDESIATVVNGTVTGVSEGTTTITATLNDKVTNKVATCKVTVKKPSSSGTTSSGSSSSSGSTSTTVKATSVKFDVKSITIYVGQKGPWKFNPTVTPSNTTEKGTWSSNDPSVATVDSNGNITIGDLGGEPFKPVTITYTVGSKSASGVVVVMAETYNPNKEESGSSTGTGTGTTTPGTNTGDSTGTGTTTPGTNTGDSTGTGTGTGTTNPGTNSDGTKKITDLILAEDKVEILLNQVYALEYDAYPKDAVESYTWTSSDESVVSVTSSGVITGKKIGTAKITITGVKSGIKSECVVTVKHKTAESVMVSPTNIQLSLGQTAKVTANLTPGDATDTVTWSSQYPSIVSVDQNGNITALQSGTVKITATTSTGKTAECIVISGITGTDSGGSLGVPTNKIKVSVYVSATGDLKAGNAYSAYLTFSPSLSAAQLSTLMYAINSSNSGVANVVRVTERDYTKNSFTVYPGEDGTATLTGFVTSSDSSLVFEYESKTVSVSSPDSNIKNPITSLTMTPTSKNLYVGDTTTLVASATYSNSGTIDDKVTWISSNENVVKVTPTTNLVCTVTAVGTGTATITCKSKGNFITNDRTATCKITVNSTGSVDSTRGIIAVSQDSVYNPTNADIGVSGTLTINPFWTANSVLSAGTSSLDPSYILSIDATGKIIVGANVPIGTSMSTSVRYVDANNTLVSRDFTIMVLNSKATSSTTVATVSATAKVDQEGDLASQYAFPNARFSSSNPNVLYVNENNGVWKALTYGYATITIFDRTTNAKLLEISFSVDYNSLSANMNVGDSKYITELVPTLSKSVESVTSNTSKIAISKLDGRILITATEKCAAKLTVTFTDKTKIYIDLSVGGSGSNSGFPSLSASTTTVTGGNQVALTMINCSYGDNVKWEFSTTITGVEFTNSNTNVPWGSTVASTTLKTPAVTTTGTIKVWATIDGVQYSPITITVTP